jgi:predicted dehydrogenase
MLRIGALGFGRRARTVLEQLEAMDSEVRLVACWDAAPEYSRKVISCTKIREKPEDVRYYDEPEQMFDKEELDGVIIGTRCNLHTPMAIKAAARGLPIFLEKPVATNMDDLRALKKAFDNSKSQVVVSFPLRLTQHVQQAKAIIDAGDIGEVQHVQAINNVTYGWGYFRGWYRDYDVTGGQWLQKATHDIDYINYLVGQPPALIGALHSQRVFGGAKPAGLKCDNCDEAQTCLESPLAQHIRDEEQFWACSPSDHNCSFGSDTKIEDNGSALIEFANGMHAVYSQNFFVRRDAGYRGANIMGHLGTIIFDFYTDTLRLIHHHKKVTATMKISGTGHGGGDLALVRNFRDIMYKRAKSLSPISAGILSAYMCLKARQAGQEKSFVRADLSDL